MHGHGIDFGASVAWGAGVNAGIEFGIGPGESKGKQVWVACRTLFRVGGFFWVIAAITLLIGIW